MSPDEREAVTRSIANLWMLNTIVISNLLRAMRDDGMAPERIERMLQSIDQQSDFLDGPDDQAYAQGMLATVRSLLREP